MTNPDPVQTIPGGQAVHDRAAEIRTKLSQLILDGRPYMRVVEQQALATEIGCHVNSVRRQLVRMKLIGRLARGLGNDPRKVRSKRRAQEERALLSEQWLDDAPKEPSNPSLQQAEVLIATQLLDARDPVQRLELLNKLATNARGDVPPAVQVAALTKIGDEYKQAGEGFGIPAPSNDDEEGQRVLAVLQSAKPECARWAIAKFQEVPVVPAEPIHADLPPESAIQTEEVQAPEAPAPEVSGGDGDVEGDVG